jgi:hypothetical protein
LEARFSCHRNGDAHRLANVKEVATCEYVFEIETPAVCHHEAFHIEEPDIQEIVCEPVKEPKAAAI